MVKMTYVGILDPEGDFEALRPAYQHTIRMMMRCRPMGDDYKALLAITEAMNGAAAHFMLGRFVSFYGAKAHSS